MRYNGQGCKVNKAEGSCILATAASLGSRKAAAYIGALYYLGEQQGGFPRCFERAKYWLQKALSAEQYLTEDFDVEKAQELLRKAEDALREYM